MDLKIKYFVVLLIGVLAPVLAACQEKVMPTTVVGDSQSKNELLFQGWLAVTRVADDDVLNMRAEPTAKAAVVYSIPYDATNLLRLDIRKGWVKVHYSGHNGWIYDKYVKESAPVSALNVFGGELFCVGTEPHWNLETQKQIVRLSELDDDTSLLISSNFRNSVNRTDTWLVSLSTPERERLLNQAIIQKQVCSDGMSEEDYPYTIQLLTTYHTKLMSGCCKLK